MNKNFLLFVIFSVFLLLVNFPLLSAACSLGANPLSMEASAKPGQEVVGTWNLYNLYGDRTTHIIIEKIKGQGKNFIEINLQTLKYYSFVT